MSKAWITTVALVAGLTGCDGPVAPEPDFSQELSVADARVGDRGFRFRAEGFTTLESLAPDPSCGEPPRLLNQQVGGGVATDLGRFTVRFRFCVDATDLLDDGQLTEGESIPYDQGRGVFTAANGDELYVAVEGVVLPSGDPAFAFRFQDAFEFDGGTGRFEGARGRGMNDSYVTQDPERTTHRWMGRLVLPRGR